LFGSGHELKQKRSVLKGVHEGSTNYEVQPSLQVRILRLRLRAACLVAKALLQALEDLLR
jgi:hypothetical protein